MNATRRASRSLYGGTFPNHLGRVYLRMTELSLAEEQFRTACGNMVRGRYTGPHAALGYTLARQGRVDEAIAEFEHCLKIEPENPAFYYFLGSLSKATRRTSSATTVSTWLAAASSIRRRRSSFCRSSESRWKRTPTP